MLSGSWPANPGRFSFLCRYLNQSVKVVEKYTCKQTYDSVKKLDIQRIKVWRGYQNSMEDLGDTTTSEREEYRGKEKEKQEKYNLRTVRTIHRS